MCHLFFPLKHKTDAKRASKPSKQNLLDAFLGFGNSLFHPDIEHQFPEAKSEIAESSHKMHTVFGWAVGPRKIHTWEIIRLISAV
jgi:hypothetical protein